MHSLFYKMALEKLYKPNLGEFFISKKIIQHAN